MQSICGREREVFEFITQFPGEVLRDIIFMSVCIFDEGGDTDLMCEYCLPYTTNRQA